MGCYRISGCLSSGWDAEPKLIMAAADAGENGRGELPVELEKALLCEEFDWHILPWQLDDIELERIRMPLYLLRIYKAFVKYSTNLDSLNDSDLELVTMIEKWRKELEDNRDGDS